MLEKIRQLWRDSLVFRIAAPIVIVGLLLVITNETHQPEPKKSNIPGISALEGIIKKVEKPVDVAIETGGKKLESLGRALGNATKATLETAGKLTDRYNDDPDGELDVQETPTNQFSNNKSF